MNEDDYYARTWEAWERLASTLPAKYRMMVQGPNKNHTWSVAVIATGTPSRRLFSVTDEMEMALVRARMKLLDHLAAL